MSMEFKDYYKTLGLSKGADAEAIKKAYRKLAAKYHPDKNPGNKQAEDRFKAINEAHEVLGDPEKKQRYDSFGADWDKQGGPGGGFDFAEYMRKQGGRSQGGSSQGFGGGFSSGDFSGGGFSDFFEAMFGGQGGPGQGRGRRASAGEDYQADIEISLEEAYHGAAKMIEIGGRKLKLNVKPGIKDGQSLRLPGKGGAGQHGGPDGDFYLRIHVAPHAVYERRDDDLHRELPVDFLTAVTGSKLEVSTLKGPIKVTIPARTDHGKVLRLKGMGMPAYGTEGDKGSAHGDLYLKVVLTLPKDLGEGEVEVLEEMARKRAKG
jgi:curved DNA-binding protein